MRIPSPVIERHGDFYVCRDDLLNGGTKRRALVKYLPKLDSRKFIYAATVFGSGGWALAEACLDLGFDCKIIISDNKYKPHWTKKFSSQIEWQIPSPIQSLYAFSQKLAAESDAIALPLGFNDPAFKNCLTEALKEINMNPSEIWMPCVSGTLVKAAQSTWPGAKLNAVCVAKHHGDLGAARKYQAMEKYHQPARNPPPFSSNIFSDAKIWSFAHQFALKDALIWNTSA